MKSVTASNGLTTASADFPSFFFSKNVIWPFTMANFILVSEKSEARKPLLKCIEVLAPYLLATFQRQALFEVELVVHYPVRS
jgi:predicted acyltransferase